MLRSRSPHLLRAAALLLSLGLWSCENDRVIQTTCREDADCQEGYLCENYVCVPAESKACEVVIDGNPILQPSPYTVSFGQLDVEEAKQKVQLHNIGNCTLTIFEAKLAPADPSPFACEFCGGAFPVEIFPGRSVELELGFKAPEVGPFSGELHLLSDDREFPELRVPLHATFLGVPSLRVTPNPIDFGYVAQGRQGKKAVQITNHGTGVAPITVKSVAIDPPASQHFELTAALDQPVTLAPIAKDGKALLAFEVLYHPRSNEQHTASLVAMTDKGEVRVPLSGNSETPPKLSYNPTAIALGQVPLGATNTVPLTLVNEGGAPLQVSYAWGGPTPTTDLFATPTFIPAIAPGAYVELHVSVTATKLGPVSGLLTLTTNDPAKPSVTIQVTAEGVPGAGPEVVKVELTYDNGSDNAFDKDLRNVDLTLEHPYGYVCNKATPSPTNWGSHGNPTWISFGPKEEPERIVLAGAQADGTFRVMLQYAEDCASLPTELAAGLVGISVDALIQYLSGGVIDVGGGNVSEIIKNTCAERKATNATVRVFVNGAVIKEQTVSLAKKGDTTYALDLVRAAGKFSVP